MGASNWNQAAWKSGWKKPISTKREEMIPIMEAMEKLNISAHTFYNRTREGRFHIIKVGRSAFVTPMEVQAEAERIESYSAIPAGKGEKMEDSIGMRISGKRKELDFLTDKEKTILKQNASDEKSTAKAARETQASLEGRISAAAFKAFDAGRSRREVVVELEINPLTARTLWTEYCDLADEWLLPHKYLAKIRAILQWEEDPPTPDGLKAAIDSFIAKEVERELSAPASTKNSIEDAPLTPQEAEEMDRAVKEAELDAQIASKLGEAMKEKKKSGQGIVSAGDGAGGMSLEDMKGLNKAMPDLLKKAGGQK